MLRNGLIVLAEDDPDDRLLLEQAFVDVGASTDRVFVEDGEDLMEYLLGRGRHEGRQDRRPDLILLDLNMPRKDGREALAEIRADPTLRRIPVVVLTTSSEEQDIEEAYGLGANSFVTKPITFDGLVGVVRTIQDYWFRTVTLPRAG
ncbi:MAG: response regulator [Myxococcota bacterium]